MLEQYFDNVVLLVHANGAHNGTTFTDSSSFARTITRINARTKTDDYKFGGASANFDGSNDYLQMADSDDFYFADGDFTIEAWIKPTNNSTADTQGIFAQRSSASSAHSFSFWVNNDGNLGFEANNNAYTCYAGSGVVTLDAWSHVCACRSGETLRLFVNGVIVKEQSITITLSNVTQVTQIGRTSSSLTTTDYKGYIDDLRVTKGVGRYTANFDVPTEQYPDENNIYYEIIARAPEALNIPQTLIAQRYVAILSASAALGSRQAVLSQAAAIITAPEAAGAPQALLQTLLPVWIEGIGALGSPGAVAWQQFAIAQGQGAIGTPQALAHFGYLARLQPVASLEAGQALARFGYVALLEAPKALGTPRARTFVLPATADVIPDDITYYFAKLTGAPDGLTDVILPMSSFSVRHRYDGPSYYQLTIPTYAYVSSIAARPNGEIVIWSVTGATEEELLRGDLGNVRTDRGPKSQSISISGNSDRATTDPATYLLSEALYASTTFAGDSRLRIKPRAAMRPGDYIRYVDINFAIGEVVWSVAVSAGGIATTMEVSSLPVTDGGTVPSDFDNLPYTEVITSNAEYQYIRRSLAVPAGTYRITTTDIPGLDSGDLDLYVKFNAAPNKLSYDCKAETLGEETCEITTASAATLHVLLLSYTVPATVTLTVSQL